MGKISGGETMNFFKGTCQECGKEIPVTRPDAKTFCGRVCESNFKYRNKFKRDIHGQNTDETKPAFRVRP